ncbi:unnamed protein product [Danaus chrysippus]|uniref:(African queen) hypothetical protein n=1 Tax=Danaus chrysippus TaxID=151541 RepID=A0A8J2QE58_9NEOP|nr:unnamed protein product [Danaus chrysippus]
MSRRRDEEQQQDGPTRSPDRRSSSKNRLDVKMYEGSRTGWDRSEHEPGVGQHLQPGLTTYTYGHQRLCLITFRRQIT